MVTWIFILGYHVFPSHLPFKFFQEQSKHIINFNSNCAENSVTTLWWSSLIFDWIWRKLASHCWQGCILIFANFSKGSLEWLFWIYANMHIYKMSLQIFCIKIGNTVWMLLRGNFSMRVAWKTCWQPPHWHHHCNSPSSFASWSFEIWFILLLIFVWVENCWHLGSARQ